MWALDGSPGPRRVGAGTRRPKAIVARAGVRARPCVLTAPLPREAGIPHDYVGDAEAARCTESVSFI